MRLYLHIALCIHCVKGFVIPKKNKIIKSIRYAESPAEIVKRIGSSYTKYGEDWTITDLNKHLKMHDIDSASLVVKEGQIQGALVFDTHYTSELGGDNLHAVKAVPELTQGLLDSLNNFNINYDITDITQRGLFDGIPLPFQIIGIYLFVSLIISRGILFEISSSKILKKISLALLVSS